MTNSRQWRNRCLYSEARTYCTSGRENKEMKWRSKRNAKLAGQLCSRLRQSYCSSAGWFRESTFMWCYWWNHGPRKRKGRRRSNETLGSFQFTPACLSKKSVSRKGELGNPWPLVMRATRKIIFVRKAYRWCRGYLKYPPCRISLLKTISGNQCITWINTQAIWYKWPEPSFSFLCWSVYINYLFESVYMYMCEYIRCIIS